MHDSSCARTLRPVFLIRLGCISFGESVFGHVLHGTTKHWIEMRHTIKIFTLHISRWRCRTHKHTRFSFAPAQIASASTVQWPLSVVSVLTSGQQFSRLTAADWHQFFALASLLNANRVQANCRVSAKWATHSCPQLHVTVSQNVLNFEQYASFRMIYDSLFFFFVFVQSC